jgi:tetratricopeptide (TPR) repeat protein
VGTQAMADRYSYIPLIGLFIITAWGADELLSGWRERKIVLGGTAIAVVLVLSVCSRLQTRYWRNSETLCRRSLEVTSGNYIMHNNLGYALQSQGKLDEATEHYYLALEIEPDFAETHNNLGIVYQTKGNIEEAMNYYRRAIELAGGHAKAHYNLGAALHSQGRLDAAIFHYRKAIEARPDDAKAHNNLGIALASQGKLDEAIEQYSQGLKAAPDNANIYYNMGTALASQGKLAEATNYYQQALKINPDDAEVHNALGLALSAQGKLDEAVRHYHQALTIRPDYLAPMSGLAWILSTHPEPESRDSKGAIEFALRAAELTGYKDGFVLNTLAACYGAAGRTDDAVRTAQKALELAEAEKDEELANQIRMLLEHYRSGKQ